MFQKLFLFISLVLFELVAVHPALAATSNLMVRVIDHVSNAWLSGQGVHAYEKASDGTLTWRAMQTTDGNGLAWFNLDGLGSGKVYVLQAQPFGYWVKSGEINASGSTGFRVGKLQVQVIDGQTGQGKGSQKVTLKRWQANGNHTWAMSAITNALGWVKLDPPDAGKIPYVLSAVSPTDGQEKDSAQLWGGPALRFMLGNAALVAQLQDRVSGAALATQWVEAWEKLADGSQVLRAKRQTNTGGTAKFDLDGLGSGRVYLLKTKPYLQAVSSGVLTTAGLHPLKAGKLQVQILDGRNGNPYAWSEVTLLEKQVDGTLKWSAKILTDGTGLLKLDPAQLGVRPYVLRAVSKVDGTPKDSPEYTAGGSYSFKVGGVGLTMRLLDHVSNVSLGGQKIDAYEKASDGTLTWRAVRTTGSDGQAQFDLDGLGTGKKYVLLAQPFGYPVKSDELSATGWYGFRVGKLQVQVVDVQTGQGKGAQKITLKRWQANGNHIWAMSATTNAQGWVKLDPPDAGKIPYVLTAVSPTDGLEKLSPQLWGGPALQFMLGNAALVAQLQDGVSGTALATHWVEAWEKLTDGSQVLRAKRQTDTGGVAKFDLDGLGSGRVYLLKAQPYLQAVNSGELTTAGPRPLKAGKLQVRILDGRNGNPYAWSEVTLLEKQVDGTLKWSAKVLTDGTGLLKLDPAQLGVRPYVLRAVSKVDGTPKDSPVYTAGGSYSFKVGGAGLTVRLTDHVSDVWLSGQGVHAYEKASDGTLTWRAVRTTDGDGMASFDLDGLGSGKVYVLQAQPFGYWVKSDEINTTGFTGFRVGTTLVTLTDANNTVPLVGKTITAFEKLPNGALRWAMQGITNAQGQAKFDLTGLGKGAVYVLRASNPFGETKDYFSSLLTWKGVFAFALQKGKTNEPDKVLPVVKISFPSQADKVVAGGFQLQGTASDNVAMKEVRAILTLPSGEVLNLPANYNAGNQTWALSTGALPNPVPGTLHVKVQGVDTSQNVSEVSLDLSLVNDTTPPVIAVSAPANGSVVPTGAFLVSGALTDNTLSPKLMAKVSGGGLASPEERAIEVASGSGRWAVMVAPDVAFTTSAITLTLTAKDGAGNTVTKVLELNPGDVYRQAWHVLQRTGYGSGPDQLAEVVQTGPANYIQQQLSPGSVDDSAFTNRQASWVDGSYLATGYLRHALYSRKQLQEVMTAFWDNHFSTFWFKHKVNAYELNEVTAFRAHALGNFRDLLEISAKSPAMLYTLDGIFSYMGSPNENYARELMELHTMGVAGGYTETDVTEVARAFTGWTVKGGAFYFDAAKHDNGTKTVLGSVIAANGGQMDGEKILGLVARHASTANRICSKLVTFFVSDVPVNGLVSRCNATYLAHVDAPDQIAQVLLTILNSPEFLGSTYRGQKFKTPLELAVNSTRNLGGESNGDDLAVELATMGMDLYTNASPTGYAETGDRWISSGQLLSRIRFLDRLLAATPATGGTQVALLAQVQARGLETAEGVVGHLLQAGLGPTVTKAQRELGLSLLTRNGALPYFNWSPDAEIRLRQLEKAIMALPEYQYQ